MSRPSYFARLAPAPRAPSDPPVLKPPRAHFRESPLPLGFTPLEEQPPRRAALPDAPATAELVRPERIEPAAPTPRARRADSIEAAPVELSGVRLPRQAAAGPAPAAAPAERVAPGDSASRSAEVGAQSRPPRAHAPRTPDETRWSHVDQLMPPVAAIARGSHAATQREAGAGLWIGTMEVKVTQAKPVVPPAPVVRSAPTRQRPTREPIARPFSSFGLRQS